MESDRPLQERFKRDAKFAVAAWNVRVIRGLPITFFPTIGAAVRAKRPFLTCVCPGCKVRGSVDLRAYGRRAMATVDTLIPALRCQRCVPNAPYVQIRGLRKSRP
ncbi:MAG: hypothetical protein JWN71_4180 [Xanthobacteraceae bacterium]|nr:hypothetical protein [Xanthobacteraceae bacterium]